MLKVSRGSRTFALVKLITSCFIFIFLSHVRGGEVTLRVLAEVFHPAERLLARSPFTVQLECFFGGLSLRWHILMPDVGLILFKWTRTAKNKTKPEALLLELPLTTRLAAGELAAGELAADCNQSGRFKISLTTFVMKHGFK